MTVWQSNLKDDSSNDPTSGFNQILKVTVSLNFVIVSFYFYRFFLVCVQCAFRFHAKSGLKASASAAGPLALKSEGLQDSKIDEN